MFLQRTSFDTVMIWQPALDSGFFKPIILSTGTGTDNFLSIDNSPVATLQHRTLNNRTYAFTRPVNMSGNVIFNPQSTALVALREILQTQDQTRKPIYGTTSIVSTATLSYTQYNKFLWTSPYPGPSINKMLTDIPLSFSCLPPVTITLGSIASIFTTLSGLGI